MKREMTVTYAPGDGKETPMIRIANRFLLEHGFTIGDKIEIKYANGFITITHKNQCCDHNIGCLSV